MSSNIIQSLQSYIFYETEFTLIYQITLESFPPFIESFLTDSDGGLCPYTASSQAEIAIQQKTPCRYQAAIAVSISEFKLGYVVVNC